MEWWSGIRSFYIRPSPGSRWQAFPANSHIYGKMGNVKTTVEMPDALFRKAKATAAERGVPLKDLFTDAVREHLQRGASASSPTWMKAFGGLRSLHKETQRINRVLEQEFGQIEEEE